MRAAILKQAKELVCVTDAAKPEPGHGEVLIRVEVCGLCHTDLHITDGSWKLPKLPLIPGHEAVGWIEEMGPGVEGLAKGDRVGVAWLHHACRICDLCIQGREMFCEDQLNTGYTAD